MLSRLLNYLEYYNCSLNYPTQMENSIWPAARIKNKELSKSFRTDIFKNRRRTMKTYALFLFKIKFIDINTGFCGVIQFLKSCRNSSFWAFFNSLITATWISATSAKWSHFKFILNLGNRKESSGDKYTDYGG